MPLTDTAIRNAKPGAKSVKMFDGAGLYLEITPSGGKLWRLKYRFMGAEKRLALGAYPAVGLKEARERRDEAKRHLADGRDPSAVKQADKARALALAADSFEAVARDWIARHLDTKAAGHRDKVVRRLERDVLPYIGRRPVAEITAPDILAVLRRIEGRGVLETAHRAQQNIGQVIRYAIATGRAVNDPTQALRGALPPYIPKHMASPADDPQAVGAILRALDAFKGTPIVATAIKLLPMVFCRPGELRTMRWEDVDLDGAQWRYIVSKTKTEHLVPLSRQAVALLRDLHPLTGHLPAGWVFVGRAPTQPMSDAAINAAYRRLGIDTRTELTGHGWRSVARTILHEHLGYEPAVIEHQLAHAVPDALGTSYNRTKFLKQRQQMMQAWADYLDKLKTGAEIIPLRA
ncbi:MAG: integrase arm-type DNA-binding domain-containing protein [Thiomonas arsenitoxydans]|jgi:integrase|uniref:Integrase arm-type DNA-binding domain-containing protein n=1 Tax=Thiomonas arsenitoxydans (strain DSM 22701 / CIP 110005 / 3As) TaxID=426114 RepID=A0A8I1N0J1_THIA3|nr:MULTISPECIES: integrase arm-type DNA-binding domain-containing protein [Thiomonas]MBN8745678.1 integrase arm-type DNA-binding domain-containing protein [Thiomonas arsenitoxydans]ODU94007.1 MAG: integrase [Thiomonas sp. SCN 64-16]